MRKTRRNQQAPNSEKPVGTDDFLQPGQSKHECLENDEQGQARKFTNLDISEHKRWEQRVSLLASLAHDFAHIQKVEQNLQAGAHRIAAFFDAPYCQLAFFDDVAENSATSLEWPETGLAALTGCPGKALFDLLTPAQHHALQAGDHVVGNDLSAWLGDAAETLSYAAASYAKDGKYRFILALCQNQPRLWHDDEVNFLKELAERLWLRMQHALAHQALQHSELRFRSLSHKLWEVDLPKSEDRFYQVFNNSPIMMAILSVDSGQFLEINQAYAEKMEYRREELIGHTPEDLGIWSNEGTVPKRVAPRQIGARIDNMETQVCTRSGKVLTVLASMELIEFNRQPCKLTALQDITDMRLMEFNLARMDRLNLIGEMAVSIGHEIRNPMTAVRGFLQMLGAKYEYTDENAYFNIMIEELDRANGIITEFLGMAKDKRIDPQPTYLYEIIRSLYPVLQANASKRNMAVRLELAYTPQIMIDENEIRQLIYNIAYNALEAMQPGGTLTIGTALQGTEVLLYVKDQGPGIPDVLLGKLGTPFLTTKEDGPGLGLAVCYSIAARHNAHIEVQSDSQGTVFYVCFSIAEPEVSLF